MEQLKKNWLLLLVIFVLVIVANYVYSKMTVTTIKDGVLETKISKK